MCHRLTLVFALLSAFALSPSAKQAADTWWVSPEGGPYSAYNPANWSNGTPTVADVGGMVTNPPGGQRVIDFLGSTLETRSMVLGLNTWTLTNGELLCNEIFRVGGVYTAILLEQVIISNATVTSLGSTSLYQVPGKCTKVAIQGFGSYFLGLGPTHIGLQGGTCEFSILQGGQADFMSDVYVGYGSAGTIGQLTVTGTGSIATGTETWYIGHGASGELLVSDSGDVAVSDLTVGLNAFGEVLVSAGGRLDCTLGMPIGDLTGAPGGRVTITGPGSQLDALSVAVGSRSAGELIVSDGGQVCVEGFFTCGRYIDGGSPSGAVTVTGPGSRLIVTKNGAHARLAEGNPLSGSGKATATVNITDGGYFETSGWTAIGWGGTATVTVSGAGSTFNCLQANFAEGVAIGGGGSGTLIVENGGTFSAASVARVGNQDGSTGTLIVRDPTSLFTASTLSVDDSPSIGAANALVVIENSQVSLAHHLAIRPGGRVELLGDVDITASIFRVPGGVLEVGTLPGTVTCDSNFECTTDGTIEFSIGGNAPGLDYSPLNFSGDASLDGTLKLVLQEDFVPQEEDIFEVLSSHARHGTFAAVIVPPELTSQGLTFRALYSPTSVALRVEPIGPATSMRVVLGTNTIPILGAELIAIPPGGGPEQHLGLSDQFGYVDITGPPPGDWHIAAQVTYTDPANGEPYCIRNYPYHDPSRTFNFTTNEEELQDLTITFPWPIVMQAGLLGGVDTWEMARNYFGEDPLYRTDKRIPSFLSFAMPNSHIGCLFCDGWEGEGYNYTAADVSQHDGNAERLAAWIDTRIIGALSTSAPAASNNYRFHLVAHSMGGLISRAYMRDNGSRIVRVVTLDATHGGTIYEHVDLTPALTEANLNGWISPLGGSSGWNREYTNRNPSNLKRWLMIAANSDDIVSPNDSAHGFGRIVFQNAAGETEGTVSTEEWIYGSRESEPTVDHHGDNAVHSHEPTIRKTANFLMTGTTGDEAMLQQTAAVHSSTPTISTSPPGRKTLRVTAAAGTTHTETIPVDSNTQLSFNLLLTGGGSYVVRDTNGSIAPFSNLQSTTVANGAVVDTFQIQTPDIGNYTIEVTADPTFDTELALTVAFDNGRRLRAGATPPQGVPLGVNVQITARITDETDNNVIGLSGTADALVRDPDGNTQTVSLLDDGMNGDGSSGDGIFGATYTTSAEGRHEVFIGATTILAAETIDRTDRTSFVVHSSGASLTGVLREVTPDQDSNGLYDGLLLEQDVLVARPGDYRFSLSLKSMSGETIVFQTGKTISASQTGTETIGILLEGPDLVKFGEDGPWQVSDITLSDQDLALLIEAAPIHVTATYNASEFEPPARPRVTFIPQDRGPFTGGQTISIHGSGLEDVTEVWFSSREAQILSTTDESVVVRVPLSKIRPKRLLGDAPDEYPVNVRIVSPWGEVDVEEGYTYSSEM